MKWFNKKSICMVLWIAAEYIAGIKRNDSPVFHAYINTKFQDIENPTILIIGELPEGIFLVSNLLLAAFITVGYMAFQYILLHEAMPPGIKYASGLLFLIILFDEA